MLTNKLRQPHSTLQIIPETFSSGPLVGSAVGSWNTPTVFKQNDRRLHHRLRVTGSRDFGCSLKTRAMQDVHLFRRAFRRKQAKQKETTRLYARSQVLRTEITFLGE